MLAAAMTALLGGGAGIANATEPCRDFGECKVLVEINSTDGDIGFHFLMDGDNLRYASLFNPNHRKIFSYSTRRELRKQFLTETFAESAEPLCFDPTLDEDEENDDEDFVTLEEFTDRWTTGKYRFYGIGEGWELSKGASYLTFDLPAAPNLDEEDDYGYDESIISWGRGDDLGECSDGMELLETAPEDVPVAIWEVVLEVDIDEEDIETPEEQAIANSKFVVRIPEDTAELEFEVEVPEDFLASLPDNTPAKVEVGAIGFDDNATFSETDEICLNEVGEDGCGFDEE